MENENEKKQFIASYFKQLFRSNGEVDGDQMQQLLADVQPRVSTEMNEVLMKEFTEEEVKKALDSIGDLKAPGPDGMPSVFFKNCWDIVCGKMTREVLQVLNGGSMPA